MLRLASQLLTIQMAVLDFFLAIAPRERAGCVCVWGGGGEIEREQKNGRLLPDKRKNRIMIKLLIRQEEISLIKMACSQKNEIMYTPKHACC